HGPAAVGAGGGGNQAGDDGQQQERGKGQGGAHALIVTPPGSGARVSARRLVPVGFWRQACECAIAAMRRFISSGETSSLWVATVHWWPNGSRSVPERSP